MGVTVGIIDGGKGAVAILIAQVANIPQIAVLLTGVAAVIGHNWPVFIGFRGGLGGEHHYRRAANFNHSANADSDGAGVSYSPC